MWLPGVLANKIGTCDCFYDLDIYDYVNRIIYEDICYNPTHLLEKEFYHSVLFWLERWFNGSQFILLCKKPVFDFKHPCKVAHNHL